VRESEAFSTAPHDATSSNRKKQRQRLASEAGTISFTYLEKNQIMNGTSKGSLCRGWARRVDRTTRRFVRLVAVAVTFVAIFRLWVGTKRA
jgi:hypothetical protein